MYCEVKSETGGFKAVACGEPRAGVIRMPISGS
jgi:hypothetical protein